MRINCGKRARKLPPRLRPQSGNVKYKVWYKSGNKSTHSLRIARLYPFRFPGICLTSLLPRGSETQSCGRNGGKMRTKGEIKKEKMIRTVSSQLAEFPRLAPTPARVILSRRISARLAHSAAVERTKSHINFSSGKSRSYRFGSRVKERSALRQGMRSNNEID